MYREEKKAYDHIDTTNRRTSEAERRGEKQRRDSGKTLTKQGAGAVADENDRVRLRLGQDSTRADPKQKTTAVGVRTEREHIMKNSVCCRTFLRTTQDIYIHTHTQTCTQPPNGRKADHLFVFLRQLWRAHDAK